MTAKLKKAKLRGKRYIYRMRDQGDGTTAAWLIERDGPASSGKLYGIMFTETAEAIAKLMQKAGIAIEREERKNDA